MASDCSPHFDMMWPKAETATRIEKVGRRLGQRHAELASFLSVRKLQSGPSVVAYWQHLCISPHGQVGAAQGRKTCQEQSVPANRDSVAGRTSRSTESRAPVPHHEPTQYLKHTVFRLWMGRWHVTGCHRGRPQLHGLRISAPDC